MTKKVPFNLKIVGDDQAYLQLPTHPGGLCKMSRSFRLDQAIGTYKGPTLVLDFDETDTLVGIEFLDNQ